MAPQHAYSRFNGCGHNSPNEPVPMGEMLLAWSAQNKDPNLGVRAPDKWCIDPNSPFKTYWDLGTLVLVMYCTVYVPFQICFGNLLSDGPGIMHKLDLTIELYFVVDLSLNFNTAFIDDNNLLVEDRKRIAARYLRGWFWIDCPSSVPSGWIMMFMDDGQGSGNSTTFLLPKLMRLLRLMRLLKLLRLLKASQAFTQLEDQLELHMGFLKIFKMLVVLLLLSHGVGCLWYHVSTWEEHEESWVDAYTADSHNERDVYSLYLYSLYWALTTMTTVGYGDIIPKTDTELVFTMVIFLVGACVFGYMMGNIASTISNMNFTEEEFNRRMDAVNEFLNYRQFPRALSAKVRKYFKYYWTQRSVFDEMEILTHLSPNLRFEVRRFLHENTLHTCSLLSDCESLPNGRDFLMKLGDKLKPVYAVKGERLAVRGQEASELCFVLKGRVTVMAADEEKILMILENGSYFGEEALQRGAKARFTAISASACDLMSLYGADLHSVLDKFPEVGFCLERNLNAELRRKEKAKILQMRTRISNFQTVEDRAATRLQIAHRQHMLALDVEAEKELVMEQMLIAKRPSWMMQSMDQLELPTPEATDLSDRGNSDRGSKDRKGSYLNHGSNAYSDAVSPHKPHKGGAHDGDRDHGDHRGGQRPLNNQEPPSWFIEYAQQQELQMQVLMSLEKHVKDKMDQLEKESKLQRVQMNDHLKTLTGRLADVEDMVKDMVKGVLHPAPLPESTETRSRGRRMSSVKAHLSPRQASGVVLKSSSGFPRQPSGT